MKDNELVIVNVNGDYSYVYGSCTEENATEALEETELRGIEEIVRYESYIKDYPDRAEHWESCKAVYENAKYEVMTYDEFSQHQRKHLLNGEVTEITEERFDEQLNVLPPLQWCMIEGVEMFCMSEMYIGTYTSQYAKVGNKYYTAMVDVCDQDTWIHRRLPNLDRMKDTLEIKVDKIQEPEIMPKEMNELPHRRIGRKGR